MTIATERQVGVEDQAVEVAQLFIEREQLKKRLGEVVVELSSFNTDTQKIAYNIAFPNK